MIINKPKRNKLDKSIFTQYNQKNIVSKTQTISTFNQIKESGNQLMDYQFLIMYPRSTFCSVILIMKIVMIMKYLEHFGSRDR